MSLIQLPALQNVATQRLARSGMSMQDAEAAANVLVTTDAMGVFTHGTKLLAGYIAKLQAGGYSSTARPRIEREGPGWAVIDGQSAMGQTSSLYSLDIALQKAKNVGIAYVGLRNTGHIGAAGYYAAHAARAGFIAMVTGNDIPSVAAPGSKGAVLGSNPLAYGIPVLNDEPILLDIATATVAGGKVYAALQRGESIPDTWLIGPDGQPTVDGSLYPHNTSLAPMAGHKGYGLGLWCELLSAVLPGGHFTWQVGSWIFDDPDKPSCHNASLVLIDVEAISPDGSFYDRLKTLIDEIHDAETSEGIDRVLLPGEREWRSLQRAKTRGIELPHDVVEKLKQAAKTTAVSLDELWCS